MKNWIVFTLAAILFVLPKITLAQNKDERKYSIQFSYGVAKTLHYNQPVNLVLCFEGCIAEEQEERSAPNVDLSVYRNLNRKNSVKVGIGFSAYKFWESGGISPGSGGLSPYETTRELKYFTISTGYRHIFETSKLISPFFETDLLWEIHRDESYFLKKSGIALKPQVGFIVRVSNSFNILVDGFYKSGIVPYNKESILNENYIPYGYGLEVGMNLRM